MSDLLCVQEQQLPPVSFSSFPDSSTFGSFPPSRSQWLPDQRSKYVSIPPWLREHNRITMIIMIIIYCIFFAMKAACFSALGFIFMTMSLTFIALDWISGEKRSLGGHWRASWRPPDNSTHSGIPIPMGIFSLQMECQRLWSSHFLRIKGHKGSLWLTKCLFCPINDPSWYILSGSIMDLWTSVPHLEMAHDNLI